MKTKKENSTMQPLVCLWYLLEVNSLGCNELYRKCFAQRMSESYKYHGNGGWRNVFCSLISADKLLWFYLECILCTTVNVSGNSDVYTNIFNILLISGSLLKSISIKIIINLILNCTNFLFSCINIISDVYKSNPIFKLTK